MAMFDFITKPINYILDVFEFISCLISYLGDVFKWTGTAVSEVIKVLFSVQFCIGFYLLHVVIEFISFIVFDVLMIIVFLPSRYIGKALGYPIVLPTNIKGIQKVKSYFNALTLYENVMPKIITKCYSFNGLAPFPQSNLKFPKYR